MCVWMLMDGYVCSISSRIFHLRSMNLSVFYYLSINLLLIMRILEHFNTYVHLLPTFDWLVA